MDIKAQSELIEQLFENGCINEEEVYILRIPQSIIVVTDIRDWMRKVDESIVYNDQ